MMTGVMPFQSNNCKANPGAMAKARLADKANNPMPSPKRFGGIISVATVWLEVLVMPQANPCTKRSAKIAPTTGINSKQREASPMKAMPDKKMPLRPNRSRISPQKGRISSADTVVMAVTKPSTASGAPSDCIYTGNTNGNACQLLKIRRLTMVIRTKSFVHNVPLGFSALMCARSPLRVALDEPQRFSIA